MLELIATAAFAIFLFFIFFVDDFKVIRDRFIVGAIVISVGWFLIDKFLLEDKVNTGRHWSTFIKEKRAPERTNDGRYILDQKQIDDVYEDGVFDAQEKANVLSDY